MRVLQSFSILFGLWLFGCSSSENGIDCQRASSTTTTEYSTVGGYDGIVFNLVGDLEVVQGASFNLSIHGPENVVQSVSSSRSDNKLILGSEACFNGDYDLTVRVVMPEVSYISMAGTGTLSSDGTITSDRLKILLEGASSIDMQIDADTLETNIIGTGSVNYSGEAGFHDLNVSGEVDLHSYNLLTDKTKVNITGVGNCQVHAESNLGVWISGIGTIYYKGTPTVEQHISGTGSVIDSN